MNLKLQEPHVITKAIRAGSACRRRIAEAATAPAATERFQLSTHVALLSKDLGRVFDRFELEVIIDLDVWQEMILAAPNIATF